MSVTNLSNYYVGKIVFGYKQQRWSESHKFATTVLATAKQRFRDVLNYRAFCLGLGAYVDYAALHLSDSPRDSNLPGNPVSVITSVTEQFYYISPPLATEVGPPVAKTALNTPAEGFLFTLYTEEGPWSSHLVRGVRDLWVAAGVSTLTHTDAIATLADGVVPGAAPTAIAALQNYISVLVSRTALIRPDGAGGFNAYGYNAYKYERISTRKVGTGYIASVRKKATV